MLGSKRVSVPPQFAKYRQQNFFIDCKFPGSNGRDIIAHKLVLARNSKLFDALFTTNDSSEGRIHFPIPFDVDNLFSEIVDFCYTHHCSIGKISLSADTDMRSEELRETPNPAILTSLYAMSLVYGISDLEFCLSDLLRRVTSKENVLELVRPYTTFRIDTSATELFPDLQDRFNAMMDTCSLFSEIIASNFEDFPPTDIYSSLTPSLFASTLQKLTDISDERRVSLIDDYVAFAGMPSMHDCRLLSEVIDWDREDSYLLFSQFRCDWVPPEISRHAISRIIDNRRTTFDCFQREMVEFTGMHYSNWQIVNCLNGIRNSEALTDFGDIELTDFLGTLGGCTNSFNPMLYRLLKPYCSPALQVAQFRDLMFDRETLSEPYGYYFLSNPRDDSPFVGYEFSSDCFIVKNVIVVAENTHARPQFLTLKMYCQSGECVFESRQGHPGGAPEWTFCVECANPVQRVVVEMVGDNTAGSRIMRVLSLRVYGRFASR